MIKKISYLSILIVLAIGVINIYKFFMDLLGNSLGIFSVFPILILLGYGINEMNKK